ncbi:MAG: hypothetical protein KME10_02160 [Plectolyngbya sp. WJT66-NPBG17]|nr:hypothetical protein [Plectolyngbya sp. WJT66-NPBG17]MBW4523984.1 hypothetical protein [Phormidium tanganyikae FI6-MK23]
MNWKPGDPLPNAENAEIDSRKFSEYSMNPTNSNNDGKWMAFEAMGYDVNNVESRELAAQEIILYLRQAILEASATPGKLKSFGPRFTVSIPFKGINGRQGLLVSVWQIDQNKDVPRLATNWLKV